MDKDDFNDINGRRAVHSMHLDEQYFRKIVSGVKTIEMRLYDERRRAIRVGDVIRFDSDVGSVQVVVRALHVFSDFAELYGKLDLTKCGYSREELASASPDDMLVYYSLEQQRKWGVVGIEIELIK